MDYDLITIGGEIAGATLGRALTSHGARVLIVERESRFRDRVRGETVRPWGVAEARALGIADLLLDTCGQEVRWWRSSAVGVPGMLERDLIATPPARAGELTFHHPATQETLLRVAAEAGAEVWRGATVVNLAPGSAPAVTLHAAGAAPETLSAQFVIAVDGRMSRVRGWAGFAVNRDPERLVVAGLLLAGARLPGDAVRVVSRAALGQLALFFPLRDGRHRAYFAYRRTVAPRPLSGQRQVPAFLAACVEAGPIPPGSPTP